MVLYSPSQKGEYTPWYTTMNSNITLRNITFDGYTYFAGSKTLSVWLKCEDITPVTVLLEDFTLKNLIEENNFKFIFSHSGDISTDHQFIFRNFVFEDTYINTEAITINIGAGLNNPPLIEFSQISARNVTVLSGAVPLTISSPANDITIDGFDFTSLYGQ